MKEAKYGSIGRVTVPSEFVYLLSRSLSSAVVNRAIFSSSTDNDQVKNALSKTRVSPLQYTWFQVREGTCRAAIKSPSPLEAPVNHPCHISVIELLQCKVYNRLPTRGSKPYGRLDGSAEKLMVNHHRSQTRMPGQNYRTSRLLLFPKCAGKNRSAEGYGRPQFVRLHAFTRTIKQHRMPWYTHYKEIVWSADERRSKLLWHFGSIQGWGHQPICWW